MLKKASYIKVPESQNRDDHGGRGPSFAVGAVENKSAVRVLSQGTLHGLQQLIKILRARTHKVQSQTHTNKLSHNIHQSVS